MISKRVYEELGRFHEIRHKQPEQKETLKETGGLLFLLLWESLYLSTINRWSWVDRE